MKIPFFFHQKNEPAMSVPAPAVRKEPVTAVDAVMSYHEETKHHYYRFARSLGYLDWDTQPNPFRRFEGAPLVSLPLLPYSKTPAYHEMFDLNAIQPEPVSFAAISRFFRNSLAISAWKRYEQARWALRVNPSSGNLHPTEGYLIQPSSLSELPAGVYHYAPREHGLEQRAVFPGGRADQLVAAFPAGTFLIGLTSIYWREAWKYGERAFRYCQHDAGHAIAALRLSAAVLGWQMILLEELSDQDAAALLGLDRAEDFHEAEDEHPDVIAAIIPSKASVTGEATIPQEAIAWVANAGWRGQANRLSLTHMEWEIIDEVALHSTKGKTEIQSAVVSSQTRANGDLPAISAEKIIQQRRSAVAFDGATSITRDVFLRILSRVVPALNPVPFDALGRSVLSTPRVHLAIFVHRVEQIEPGLYMLVRDAGKIQDLQAAAHSRFDWRRLEDSAAPLFHLESGVLQGIAAGVSCGQSIAGDGAFALGMIAEFEAPIRTVGAWLYPRLFWETGIIGQILYLEAEAAGIRATGIGCYFDDPMHEALGFQDRRFQSLYHFTMGGPVDDTRLTTEDPYPSLTEPL